MELIREKNVATRITFPLIDAANRPDYFSGTAWAGLTNASITAYYSDSGGVWTLFSPSNTPTEAGSTGTWDFALIQSEQNHDQIKLIFNADEIDQQTILINNVVYQKVAAVESNIRGADSDTLKTLSDQLDSVQTSVDGISNVTRLSVGLPTYFSRPASGNKPIKVEVALKDVNGNMEDPDGQQLALTVYNSSGTSRNTLLYKDESFSTALDDGTGTFTGYKKLERAGTGLYYFYYKLESTATEEELQFKFGWEENSAALYELRASQVTDATNDINAIRLVTDQFTFTGGDVHATLNGEQVDVSSIGASALTAIIDQLKNSTGWTRGGTSTFQSLMKLAFVAWIAASQESGGVITLDDIDNSSLKFQQTRTATTRTKLAEV